MLKIPAAAALAACCFLLGACATTGTESPSAKVEPRAQARWDALLAGRLEAAYEYLSPGYRSSVSLLEYQRSVLTRKVEWLGAELIDSECSENTCKVRISIDYRLWAAVPGVPKFEYTMDVTENWIRSNGQWWFVPDE